MIRKDETHTTSLRRAALFMSSLDSAVAQALMEQLAPHERDQLQYTLATLGHIQEEERQDAIQQFLVEGGRRAVSPPEPDEIALSPVATVDRVTDASRNGRNRRVGRTAPRSLESTDGISFRSLIDSVPLGMLADVVRDEQPQMLALILSRVSSRQAAELLGMLEPEMQVDVARRIAELGTADAEVVADVEYEVVQRLAVRAEQLSEEVAGSNLLQSILTAADRNSRTELVQNIANQDTKLAARLGLVSCCAAEREPEANSIDVLMFDDLVMLDDARLLALFQQVDQELAALALTATHDTLLRRVLSLMPSSQARAIEQQIMALAPVRLSDIDQAQRQLLEIARDQTLV